MVPLHGHHAHARVAGAQGVERLWHEPPRGRADHAEPGLAGDLAVERVQVGVDGLHLAVDAAGARHHHGALGGQEATLPVDERGAELALQPGDVGRHVRLHGVERFGGARERPVVGDRGEGGELAEIHHRE